MANGPKLSLDGVSFLFYCFVYFGIIGSVWISFILLKTENNKKIIKKLMFMRGLLFICLNALYSARGAS